MQFSIFLLVFLNFPGKIFELSFLWIFVKNTVFFFSWSGTWIVSASLLIVFFPLGKSSYSHSSPPYIIIFFEHFNNITLNTHYFLQLDDLSLDLYKLPLLIFFVIYQFTFILLFPLSTWSLFDWIHFRTPRYHWAINLPKISPSENKFVFGMLLIVPKCA